MTSACAFSTAAPAADNWGLLRINSPTQSSQVTGGSAAWAYDRFLREKVTVDSVSAGKKLVEEVETPQDR